MKAVVSALASEYGIVMIKPYQINGKGISDPTKDIIHKVYLRCDISYTLPGNNKNNKNFMISLSCLEQVY